MNKDNLIEFARDQCEIFPEDSYMGKYLRETLKMLQAEPSEEVEMEKLQPVKSTQRWIPVSERLPDIHNYSAKYLTTVKGAGIHILSFTECAGKHWWAYKGVIAWMPLPEEYEADTDNEKLD